MDYESVKRAIRDSVHTDEPVVASIVALMKVRNKLGEKLLPVQYLVLSDNLWKFFVYDDAQFAMVCDGAPEEEVVKGVGCYVYGMTLIPDYELPDNTIGVVAELPDRVETYRCTMTIF